MRMQRSVRWPAATSRGNSWELFLSILMPSWVRLVRLIFSGMAEHCIITRLFAIG